MGTWQDWVQWGGVACLFITSVMHWRSFKIYRELQHSAIDRHQRYWEMREKYEKMIRELEKK